MQEILIWFSNNYNEENVVTDSPDPIGSNVIEKVNHAKNLILSLILRLIDNI